MSINVLIVVAHTDDETLGVGGSIAKHVLNGDKVFAISMTDGVGSRENQSDNSIQDRELSSYKASNILGFKWLKPGKFPDNAMDKVGILEIIKIIESAKTQVNPSVVYTHSYADLNIDHQILSKAVLTAFRPQPGEICNEIRTFEVPSSTEYGNRSITNIFVPNLYVNITETWNVKKQALHAYEQEMRDSPHPRSIRGLENLAKFRGNQCGLDYAESFEVLRRIER